MHFSRLKIFTLFVNFENPNKYKSSVNDKLGKSRAQVPMTVIFFTSENSFKAYFQMFQQTDKKTSKFAYPTHDCLMIFMKTRKNNKKPLINFCMKPLGNPINLRFDSQLIVKCYDEKIIQEWYSLIENTTSVYDLAIWDIKNGFKLNNNLTKYERRGGLKGKKLRIATSDVSIEIRKFYLKI